MLFSTSSETILYPHINNSSVYELKQQVAPRVGISPKQQVWVCGGKILNNQSILSDIHQHTAISIVVSLPGGVSKEKRKKRQHVPRPVVERIKNPPMHILRFYTVEKNGSVRRNDKCPFCNRILLYHGDELKCDKCENEKKTLV